ncbi:hypothetical protein PENANT_c009G07750 [Penicillium antarcticum]|uniref:Ribonuclease H2 subunit B n=1 Tax=Penicillium antarcticum TaxID=416450 RepID=A0A1V6Q8W0_9EURO|nr:uncharacterized protein N7508_008793 [Penicillium antarcticum]KAJ5293972.1 hypothetical protein N7508_008793 [Penicillium antarcticum]OQD85665.1 hypothetical protein PENANT_c009G07750 [Penicillium antarcticum]
MKTRSAPAKDKKSETTEQSQPKALVSETPSKTFILPSASDNARLLSLPQPQSGELSRYFFCPERGLYEFTVVAPPAHMARSILFTPQTHQFTLPSEEQNEVIDDSSLKPTITKKAELFVATPIDAMFFMVPLLAPFSKPGQSLFQPLDDIIDSNDDMPKHFRQVLYDETFRSSLLTRVEAICDSVEAGDEKMFRFNETKLVKELIAKAERMADRGFPVTLEERFIRQTLATPLMSVKREDVVTSQELPEDSEEASKLEERQDSPSTVATNATPSVETPAGESTPVPQPPGTDSAALDHVTRLLRISTALNYMKECYLPDEMAARLDEILASAESPLDLKPLKDRLKKIAELRAQALESRNMSDFTRKRALDDEEEDVRAEKKRKKDEEEKKKKAAESQAVKNLKKVNISGMQKMSAFFAKAPPKKKT